MKIRFYKSLITAGLITLLTACGGGSSGSGSDNHSNGGDSGDNNAGGSSTPVGDGIIPENNAKPATELEAARFLQRATFGANRESVQELMDIGYSAWIDKQLNMPYQTEFRTVYSVNGKLRQAGRKPVEAFEMGPYQLGFLKAGKSYKDERTMLNANRVWLIKVLKDPDQLKQRIAFALSQIMVASTGTVQADAGMRYLDLLLKNSNGTYRQLLEDVTLNPFMGNYLDMAGNAKAGTKKNSVADENYAREVLQLFSIGLYELNMDGTRKRDDQNNFIDSYQQNDVEEYARAFTGWSYPTSVRGFFHKGKVADLYNPMKFFPRYHDTGEINLLNGKTISGNDPDLSLGTTLDSIAEHPNVAPFISKQLIQKLVKSNPTPEYVERVATAFNRSGGNIGVTVKALLLDPENLDPSEANIKKVKEPLLGYVQLLRATKARMKGKTKYPGRQESSFPLRSRFAQAPMQAPSVFNFYKPEYAPASFTQCEGAQTPGTPDCPVAPELEVYSDLSYISMMNTMQNKVFNYNFPYNTKSAGHPQNLHLELRELFNPSEANREKVRDELNRNIEIYLLGHKMPAELKTQVDKLQASGLIKNSTRNIVKETLAMVIGAPQFWVQR